MRILLDECVDESLRHSFIDHDCQTCRFAGFGGFSNPKLLAAAENAGFDVLITVDQNLPDPSRILRNGGANFTSYPLILRSPAGGCSVVLPARGGLPKPWSSDRVTRPIESHRPPLPRRHPASRLPESQPSALPGEPKKEIRFEAPPARLKASDARSPRRRDESKLPITTPRRRLHPRAGSPS